MEPKKKAKEASPEDKKQKETRGRVIVKAMVLRKQASVVEAPLRLEEVPLPEPGPGEVRVRVLYCGVCHTDLHIVVGELTPPALPLIPGHQVVGVVSKLGGSCSRLKVGDRVGMAWLHQTCGRCSFCRAGLENLCEDARFTGFHAQGGFAEFTVVPEEFAYPIPERIASSQAAPLLCAGIIGYRCLAATDLRAGDRLGLYGFGAAAHIAIQIARHRGMEVFVFTRSAAHRDLAGKLGASWAGGAEETPPALCRGSIVFAPAGPLVPRALEQIDKAGTVVLGGIYMSPVPEMDYTRHLYNEKILRSVTASTRRDGEELLAAAAEIPVRTETEIYPLEQANEALLRLAESRVNGEAVLSIAGE
jgi:alcohol dehydrogenase, propanol-preferring